MIYDDDASCLVLQIRVAELVVIEESSSIDIFETPGYSIRPSVQFILTWLESILTHSYLHIMMYC